MYNTVLVDNILKNTFKSHTLLSFKFVYSFLLVNNIHFVDYFYSNILECVIKLLTRLCFVDSGQINVTTVSNNKE